jgi:hypothetical protein
MIRLARRSFVCSILAVACVGLGACASPEAPTIAGVQIGTGTPNSIGISGTTDASSSTASTSTPAPPTATPAAPPPPTFDPKFCPLTGLPAEGIDWTQRRAILVQIGNSPPERPQSELALADVVFEHLAEGGLTRFSAVYLCRAALNIGPVRSGRLVNLENAPMLSAIFVHVGASDGVIAQFAASEISQARFDEYIGDPGITRISTRNPPFNAYTSTELIWSLARERGMIPGPRYTVLQFGDAPAAGSPAARIDLPIQSGVTDVAYAYDSASGLYLRSMGGFPHTDLSTGQPLSAANVLVIYAAHTPTDIIEDSLGSRSIRIDLTSGGRVQLLRDGQVYDGGWSRPDPHAFFELKDAAGNLLRLKPGVTWIQIVPTDFVVEIK